MTILKTIFCVNRKFTKAGSDMDFLWTWHLFADGTVQISGDFRQTEFEWAIKNNQNVCRNLFKS